MLTCVTVLLKGQRSFFLVSLPTAILALAVHTRFKPMVDEGLDDFVEVGHWLVMLMLIVLVGARELSLGWVRAHASDPHAHTHSRAPQMMRDTAMFSESNYWTADLALGSVTITLLVIFAGKSIVGFLGDICRSCYSGAMILRWSAAQRGVGGQVAPFEAGAVDGEGESGDDGEGNEQRGRGESTTHGRDATPDGLHPYTEVFMRRYETLLAPHSTWEGATKLREGTSPGPMERGRWAPKR